MNTNQLKLTRFPVLQYTCKEAINTLCTNLTFSGSDKKKIMFTSCMAHEGKSFITLCALRTLAQLGRRVVMVDSDLRKSQVAAKYGLKIVEGSGQGCTHYLAGMCSLEDVVYETDVPGAYMIPVGHNVNNSLSLLSTPRFGEMLDQLAQEYDYVLVDTPPVGVIVDAAEIAKFCDGAVFVVKENFTSRRELLDCKLQVLRAGCEPLGAVLNNVNIDSLSSKKYYNKHYYSHYDYYTPTEEDIAATKKRGLFGKKK